MKKIHIIGLTMGDPGGIGPEVVLKALGHLTRNGDTAFVIFGSADLLKQPLLESLAESLPLTFLDKDAPVPSEKGIYFLDCYEPENPIEWGYVTAENGRASYRYIEDAVAWAMHGRLDAIVTAPISKSAFDKAGIHFTGHTPMLESLTGSPPVSMAFYTPRLNVVLATVHTALASVPGLLNDMVLDRSARHAVTFAHMLGIRHPKIALAGLNPHAGEHGLFGDEEEVLLAPFVNGWNATQATPLTGPLPPDTLFHRAYNGEFDVVIALYHDQGLIPVKMTGFHEAVNVTVGLPFVRTSPDHGTAFDIAYKGIASCESFLSAVRLAIKFLNK